MKKVLIVIDMQNDRITGPLGNEAARAIVPSVVERILNFDGEILFTMDTHSEGEQICGCLKEPHCVAGTEGWTPEASFWMSLMNRDAADEDHMVMKDAFGSDELPLRLHERYGDIDSVTLIGLNTEHAVLANAVTLKTFFPEAEIIVDGKCCAGQTPEGHKNALKAMETLGIKIC